ncbi:MAG: hypothetical protein PVJ05_02205 [Candidatus Thorarchaeota archaeon]|jgi:hypothetical protein
MVTENSKAIVVATIIIIAVSATAFLSMFNSDNPVIIPSSSEIASLTICGNSSDLLYPELAEANLVFLENETWLVNAHFVDDSAGYEDPEIYDQNFTITTEEIESINDALYEGLNQTYFSEISVLALLEPSPSIWYEIDITYTDGSWIYIAVFQTNQGHIILNNGTGTLDKNLLNGEVLEPSSALDCLVSAIYTVFTKFLG